MFFLTNHDENSWNATIQERYGENWKSIAALVYTLPQSLPLMYTGEEAGLARRLKFFEKDPIKYTEWNDTSRYSFYRSLINLHHTQPALKNNQAGGKFEEFNLLEENTGMVYAYKRTLGKSEVIVMINLAQETAHFNIEGLKLDVNNYQSITSSQIEEFRFNEQIEMPPYSFLILHK
jgi:glycosidase